MVSVNRSSSATVSSSTTGTRRAAASCSLRIGTPAATSASSEAGTSSKPTVWWQMSKTTPRCRRASATARLTGTPASAARVRAPAAEYTCSVNQATVSAVVSR